MLVTPSPGQASQVLDLLLRAKTTIGNHHGNPTSYLNWANENAQVLRNQVRPTDIDRLVFTPRFCLLTLPAGSPVASPNAPPRRCSPASNSPPTAGAQFLTARIRGAVEADIHK